jgi:pectate lyase
MDSGAGSIDAQVVGADVYIPLGADAGDLPDAFIASPDAFTPPLDTGGTCVARTCAEATSMCGSVSDGCGGTITCSCVAPASCMAGTCRAPVLCSASSCPAFPGAEGEGANARGGRGGDVCHVTTLSNSGAGSFRSCVEGTGDRRTVVFDIAGRIRLTSPLRGRRSRLTIAGQTAPGDGIQVSGYQVMLEGDDIIVQHMRFRAGDEEKGPRASGGFTEDSFDVGGNNIIVDHVSASWGIDECLSTGTDAWDNLTIQWSIMSEGLHQTGLFHGERDTDYDPGGPRGHAMGSLFKPSSGDSHLSLHHNLYAHNNNRNPAIGTYSSSQSQWADIRNNVLYNWADNPGYASGTSRAIYLNYVGNYGVQGPSTDDAFMFDADAASNLRIFIADNRLDTNHNTRFDGAVTSSVVTGSFSRSSTAHTLAPVTTHPSADVIGLVLDQSGARPWSRDAVDERVVANAHANTGRLINSQDEVGGWGTLDLGTRVVDGDRDGMPDDYERTHATNPATADNNGDVDGDGYTNLENYLHWAARYPR